jgi:UDP-N-acetyl-D-glucosamine dehydrogenase
MRNYDFSRLASIELTEELMWEQDAVVIATDHTDIDYQWLVDHSSLVVDTRNATRKVTGNLNKIVRA